jgi:hypothetical protein
MGTAMFSLRSVLWKCFLWGLIPGYITRADRHYELVTNTRLTRPLVRGGARHWQNSKCQTEINIWSWAPDGARHQDGLTDWSSVVKWLWLYELVEYIVQSWGIQLVEQKPVYRVYRVWVSVWNRRRHWWLNMDTTPRATLPSEILHCVTVYWHFREICYLHLPRQRVTEASSKQMLAWVNLNLKMKAVHFSEMLVNFYHTMWYNIP